MVPNAYALRVPAKRMITHILYLQYTEKVIYLITPKKRFPPPSLRQKLPGDPGRRLFGYEYVHFSRSEPIK
jgi:hypothetical protein